VNVLQPSAQATILGRAQKVDIGSAALVNGITSHTFDFDDTHLKTIIYPAGPVASALFTLAEHTGATGRQVIDALVLGIDVACRMGNTVYPEHYAKAGISRAPRVYWEPPQGARACWAWILIRRRWHWVSLRPSPLACASSLAP